MGICVSEGVWVGICVSEGVWRCVGVCASVTFQVDWCKCWKVVGKGVSCH